MRIRGLVRGWGGLWMLLNWRSGGGGGGPGGGSRLRCGWVLGFLVMEQRGGRGCAGLRCWGGGMVGFRGVGVCAPRSVGVFEVTQLWQAVV